MHERVVCRALERGDKCREATLERVLEEPEHSRALGCGGPAVGGGQIVEVAKLARREKRVDKQVLERLECKHLLALALPLRHLHQRVQHTQAVHWCFLHHEHHRGHLVCQRSR